jgi:transcription elongation factor Elf1
MKIKNPKRATRSVLKKYEAVRYQIECPHCYTTLIGGAVDDDKVLMFSCYHCGNPIDLREKKLYETNISYK